MKEDDSPATIAISSKAMAKIKRLAQIEKTTQEKQIDNAIRFYYEHKVFRKASR